MLIKIIRRRKISLREIVMNTKFYLVFSYILVSGLNLRIWEHSSGSSVCESIQTVWNLISFCDLRREHVTWWSNTKWNTKEFGILSGQYISSACELTRVTACVFAYAVYVKESTDLARSRNSYIFTALSMMT